MKINNPILKAKQEIKYKKRLELWKSVFPTALKIYNHPTKNE